jgi:hypothetical protein
MAYQKYKQHRLPDYDYTQPGSYFITICIHELLKNNYKKRNLATSYLV